MKLAVIGSRDFNNYEQLCEHLDTIQTIDTIVSGGAKGADSLAAKYAIEHNIELIEHKPDWQKYGRGAGIVRNKLIIADSDEVIAFWDGSSKGTLHSIKLAEESGKNVTIVIFEKTLYVP